MGSSYASRLRTGSTLLMQPIISQPTLARNTNRRGGVINYADPGSGDDLAEAGPDSDDSDFLAGSSTRAAMRVTRTRGGPSVQAAATALPAADTPPPKQDRTELDQAYLGQIPPTRFIQPRAVIATAHDYPPPYALEAQAERRTSLVPIRVEFETDTHRIRDCFVWNVNEGLITPDNFARIFCNDIGVPISWSDTVSNQIRAQLEEHEGIASMNLGGDSAIDVTTTGTEEGEEIPECRVIISIDVQIANHHLMDHIEWDLLSPLTPEVFAQSLASELGLSGEAVPLIAHAIHAEIIKHKKDAVEWGVIGGDRGRELNAAESAVKDKTGLGMAWARSTKEGRGPKPLRSVWRDWAEAEEFRTRFEVLTAEEAERREYERERASRRLRRETSKFQSSTRTRRR